MYKQEHCMGDNNKTTEVIVLLCAAWMSPHLESCVSDSRHHTLGKRWTHWREQQSQNFCTKTKWYLLVNIWNTWVFITLRNKLRSVTQIWPLKSAIDKPCVKMKQDTGMKWNSLWSYTALHRWGETARRHSLLCAYKEARHNSSPCIILDWSSTEFVALFAPIQGAVVFTFWDRANAHWT